MVTIGAVLIAGYHPGIEDDGVYLPAIQRGLDPTLFPHDSDFFTLQLQATVFDKAIALSKKLTHAPLPVVLLAWHLASIFLILLACYEISRRCFQEEYARWAAVCTIAALLTLTVAGTALYLVDQYLHPRAIATAGILFAIVAVLDRRSGRASGLLVLACAFHPLMGALGISLCVFLGWKQAKADLPSGTTTVIGVAAFVLSPLRWIFQPVSAAWRVAAQTRDYYFLGRWEWYEWLGVFAPLLIVYWFGRIGSRKNMPMLSYMSKRLNFYGVFQLAVAFVIMLPPDFERLRPFQPMRYLHLYYILFLLFSGGLIGKYFLRRSVVRWLVFFLPLCAGMYWSQRVLFPASDHIEITYSNSKDPWVAAFEWVKNNTPKNAYFALDPYYMERPCENYHSFRALAERSALADYVKDPSVSTQVPELAPRWQQEVQAQAGWEHFQQQDFERLKAQFGVNWVLVEKQVAGLICPYRNRSVFVCQVP